MMWLRNVFSNSMAIAVAIAYLITALFKEGIPLVLHTAMYLLLPMTCILYSENMGGATGGRITKSSPAFLVRFMGWVMLLLVPVLYHFIGQQK